MSSHPIKVLGLLQARVSSSRLPGKVLKAILGKPMLLHQIERLQRSKELDKLVVVTSKEASDTPLVEILADNGIEYFRGSLHDVLDRYYQAALSYNAQHVVRLTGDCPLIDPDVVDQVIRAHLRDKNDYTSNTLFPTYPDGLDVEIMRMSSLQDAWQEARLSSEREHVTLFITKRKERFSLGNITSPEDLSGFRWTVDEPRDFDVVTAIYNELYPENNRFSTADILVFLQKKPELTAINQCVDRNMGLKKSLAHDQDYLQATSFKESMNRYNTSNQLVKRALKTIPLASQTFSKSISQFPQGVSPLFIERGQGSHVWDVDGNEYVDFVNALASVTLGYNDPEVTKAVHAQIEQGVSFSLPHRLEMEVAEMLVEMIPCAEMVRFGKNGTDATSAAIRLARAFTEREHVVVCGYHGWQDWYIGSTSRNLGVPQSTRKLTHTFTYNDLDSLEQIFQEYPSQVAAVIMEPMNVRFPENGYLESVKQLAHKNGTLLIFDEIITGCRFAKGGAQEFFSVTPDMATFGKGLANGFPLSAIVGGKDIMTFMEKIFFSGTFGGETASLAAAKAVLTKIDREPVLEHMATKGQVIIDGINKLIAFHRVEHIFSTDGHPSWSFLLINEKLHYPRYEILTLFLQEIFKRGIITLGTHNLSYAHSDSDITLLLNGYDQVFPIIRRAVDDRKLEKMLETEPLKPLFRVR